MDGVSRRMPPGRQGRASVLVVFVITCSITRQERMPPIINPTIPDSRLKLTERGILRTFIAQYPGGNTGIRFCRGLVIQQIHIRRSVSK